MFLHHLTHHLVSSPGSSHLLVSCPPLQTLLALVLWKGNTHFLSLQLQETARPHHPVPSSFHPFLKTFKQRQSVLLWPAAVLEYNGLGLSSLELVGTSWNHGPFPHRWALQPLALQTLLVLPHTEYFAMFKYRDIFFSHVRVKLWFECWITSWWVVLHYLVHTKLVIKEIRWWGLLISWVTHIYFLSLCGNINFQKLPGQFFRNSLKKENKWY